jgi:hypothetical protein
VGINRTLVEATMCTFTLESTDFIFDKCPIYTHDGASVVSEVSRKNKKGGVIIPDDNIT